MDKDELIDLVWDAMDNVNDMDVGLLDFAKAVAAAIEQAGFVVVPREPTEAMLAAGNDEDFRMAVENYAAIPLLVERRCGGWLAISGKNEPLKIGVTAETEEGAARLFDSTFRAWCKSLAEGGSRG